jgi:hypothetical protein
MKNNMMREINDFLFEIEYFRILPPLDDLIQKGALLLPQQKLGDKASLIIDEPSSQDDRILPYYPNGFMWDNKLAPKVAPDFFSKRMQEWLIFDGGKEAVRKWQQYKKGEEYEKEYFLEAYKFKRLCIYIIDTIEESLLINDPYGKSDNILDILRKIEGNQSKILSQINKQQDSDNSTDVDNHFLMQMFKKNFPNTYIAMKNGIRAGVIEYKDKIFNFKCDRGCVGLVFSESGCTDYKHINEHILINDKKPAKNTLKNCRTNSPPSEWKNLKKIFFPTISK